MITVHADKPILLITSTPGGGKTALAVQVMAESVASGRPLYVMGIPELKVEHLACPPIAEWTEHRPDPDNPSLSLPFFTFPENAVIVLDEAQRVFRLRASAAKVPDHVAAFETVRHTGVTFVLITQHPSFIDSHIRNLVGQHIHLRDLGLLGRRYYEWPECAAVSSYASAPIKKPFKLPKSSFSLYKSASTHIKRRYTMPPALSLALVCLALVVAGGGYLYKSLSSRFAPAETVAGLSDLDRMAHGGAPGASRDRADVVPSKDLHTELLLEREPRIRSRAETAPIYDLLRVAVAMPVVAGCVSRGRRCQCYTQQATDAGLDDSECRAWIERRPFDPYREEVKVTPVSGGGVAVVPVFTDGAGETKEKLE